MSDARFGLVASDGFEWDANKSDSNLAKHGIALAEASEAFEEPVVVRKSNRSNEERWIAVGRTHGRMVTVVFTIRGRMIRIISARHPRPDEKRAYGNASMGRTTPGQN